MRPASPRAHATMRARATQANSNARVSCPFPAGFPAPRVRLTVLTYLEGMKPVALPHASCRVSPAASSARPASLAAGLARLTLATPRQVVLRSCLDSHRPRLGGCAMQRRPAPSRSCPPLRPLSRICQGPRFAWGHQARALPVAFIGSGGRADWHAAPQYSRTA